MGFNSAFKGLSHRGQLLPEQWPLQIMWLPCSRPCSHASHNDVSVNDGPHIRRWREFLETLDKLIVEENYLPEQIFNMDETSLFW